MALLCGSSCFVVEAMNKKEGASCITTHLPFRQQQGQDIGEGKRYITSNSSHPRGNHRNAAVQDTDHTDRTQPSNVGYAAEAHYYFMPY